MEIKSKEFKKKILMSPAVCRIRDCRMGLKGPITKEKILKSPAICHIDNWVTWITDALYSSEEEAKEWNKGRFHSWPAMIVIEGKSVPLQFEVEETWSKTK